LLGVATELAKLEDASTAAPAAADGLDYLLPVIVEGAKEHPSLQAVEAVALLSAFVLLAGRGVLGVLR
jgi:hypothetical protein